MEKGERSVYSQEKLQAMFGKLPSCLVTTNLWQNSTPLLFNEMLPFFIKYGLISENQSGFKPGDSCVS